MKSIPAILLAALTMASVCQAAQKPKRAATHYKVSSKQAAAIALKKYHGRVIGKVALENEDGKMQYSVNVKSGRKLREVMVDAKSGKIASVEITTKAEEAREAAAEKKHKTGGK